QEAEVVIKSLNFDLAHPAGRRPTEAASEHQSHSGPAGSVENRAAWEVSEFFNQWLAPLREA
ncbi:Diacylglycerol O-acyltransferase 2, partial [Dissostichus eleginoides]